MASTEDNGRTAPGKPTAVIDHVDDMQALDMVMRAVGAIARARGVDR